ncbi:MAG: choline-sulfatase [Gammaproteobacteria bacterium]
MVGGPSRGGCILEITRAASDNDSFIARGVISKATLKVRSMPETPNILVIMVDQMTPFFAGAYGHPRVLTPNLDKLASRGTRFDAAYTPCPICAPARAGMMTGRHVSKIGCNDNGDSFSSMLPTFAHYLSNAGYDTTLSGKMHFVGPDQLHGFRRRLTTDVYPSTYDWSYDPLNQGEDVLAFDFYKQYLAENVGPGWSLELQFDEENQFRSLEYLRENHEQPFALVSSFTSPHPPFIAPRKYWDMYEDVEIDLPDYPQDMESNFSVMDHALSQWHGTDRFADAIRDPDNLRAMRRGYYALYSYIDDKVGELINVLEEQGIRDQTAVFFVADHGDMIGEKGMIQKRSFYDHSARIPFIADIPGYTRTGPVIAPVSLIDLAPTLLDVAQVPVESRLPMDGVSVLPLMDGEVQVERIAVAEYHAEGVFRACFMIRKGSYKYVYIDGADHQLFNLDADPGEWNNLCGMQEFAEIENSLKQLIESKFDVSSISPSIDQNLEMKRVVLQAMHTNQTHWDYQPFFDASSQYVRTDKSKKYIRT